MDGVHFDRIRTPDQLYSYDPISVARMADPRTNPAGLSFHQWTADQITRNVRDIYAAVMAVKPRVKVSAAVFPSPISAPLVQHQDARAWLSAGALDLVVAMDYSAGGQGSSWDSNLQMWLAFSNGRQVLMGQHAKNPFSALLAQVELIRMRGGAGTSLFSWSTFTPSLQSQYATIAYPAPVPPKPMSWKDTPTTGIIQGFVKDIVGNEVVDAQAQRSGSSYAALSSGDGYYAHLLVPPGTYGITATHPDYAPASTSGISVAAGDVKRVDPVFTTVLVPKARLAADNATVIIGNPVTLMPKVALPAGDSVTSWTLNFGDDESLTGVDLPTPAVHIYPATGSYQASFTLTTVLYGTSNSKLVISIVPPPPIPGDFDADRDVDQDDFGYLQGCLSGSTIPQVDPACQAARLDGDEDVDRDDVALFVDCWSGPRVPADPDCAN